MLNAGSEEDLLTATRRCFDGGLKFELLVTDHLMPGMTGRELARTVQERRRDVSVLVISGYAEVDGIAGDLPRLTKPFRKSELASSLTSLLADNLAPAALRARGESSQT